MSKIRASTSHGGAKSVEQSLIKTENRKGKPKPSAPYLQQRDKLPEWQKLHYKELMARRRNDQSGLQSNPSNQQKQSQTRI